eukprot:CAMPEP_0179980336 /NCGR_PEP_ID=MMETSP0983-20121128/41874_1 /TAXON_ID=483367 /ORGANISM="non described non described, Strain CCMP 2436" /LENGTH=288 /DNA_ID=CAMNT_0021898255 /DNA_START=365 /DNA_END=1231 /DNA_ORIENTATION=+
MKGMVKRDGSCELLKGKILANVFFEPSTRTMCSFAAAMLRLGGQVIPVNESSSSAQKGETLSDTIKCLECYADIMVLRHPVKGSAAEAAAAASKPVINAGDGVGEHPTQALLDLYTMQNELGTLRGLTVTCLGDLKNGRTVHSLVQLCATFGMKLHLVSPPSLRMPKEVLELAASRANGWANYEEHESLDAAIAVSDVLYVTRVQKERFSTTEKYDAVKVHAHLKKLSAIALFQFISFFFFRISLSSSPTDPPPPPPLPPFRQMENGMYVRMALLALILKSDVLGKVF